MCYREYDRSCHSDTPLPLFSAMVLGFTSVSHHLRVPLLWNCVLQTGGILHLDPYFYQSSSDWFCYCFFVFRNGPLFSSLKRKEKKEIKNHRLTDCGTNFYIPVFNMTPTSFLASSPTSFQLQNTTQSVQ